MKKLIFCLLFVCLSVHTAYATKPYFLNPYMQMKILNIGCTSKPEKDDSFSRTLLELQIEVRELRKKNEYLHTRVDSLFALLYFLGERVSALEEKMEGIETASMILPMHLTYRETL